MTEISKEGDLVIYQNEGGYASDTVCIDGVDVSDFVAILFDIKPNSRGSVGDQKLGPVRITITRLEIAS